MDSRHAGLRFPRHGPERGRIVRRRPAETLRDHGRQKSVRRLAGPRHRRGYKRNHPLCPDAGNPQVRTTEIFPDGQRKGLQDFIQLRNILPKTCSIVLVGLDQRQIKELPQGIIGIRRTENVEQLRNLYTSALVYVNPTWDDNFPTTNLEALACGTPVITYRTGGSPEAISPETGFIVEQGDIQGMVAAIKKICQEGKGTYSKACRYRAVWYFNKEERFQEYIDLYNSIICENYE